MSARPSPANTLQFQRWLVLAVGFIAQASVSITLVGLPSLAVALRSEFSLSLNELGFLLASFPAGMAVAMLAWGVTADRIGERIVMSIGLAVATIMLYLASNATSVQSLGLLLFLAGTGASAVNASGGRSVMGWFASSERGLAMSLRHAAMPVGGAIGAAILPYIAHHSAKPLDALLVCSGACAVGLIGAALALSPGPYTEAGAPPSNRTLSPPTTPKIRDVLRKPPFRANLLASGVLVVPQFGLQSFMLIIAVDLGGASVRTAAIALACAQLLGGAARIGAGLISDRLHSRGLVFRAIALAATAAMILNATLAALEPRGNGAVFVLSLAVGVTILTSWNAVALTAAAESAGHVGTGTALGIHNSLLVLLGMVTPPIVAMIATSYGWSGTLTAMALCCLASTLVLFRRTIDTPA